VGIVSGWKVRAEHPEGWKAHDDGWRDDFWAEGVFREQDEAEGLARALRWWFPGATVTVEAVA
jgi:hypothetical protein